MTFTPSLTIPVSVDGRVGPVGLGHPLLDDYLAFVAARARPNTWLATAYDLKVFFSVVGKEPAEVRRRTCSRSWLSSGCRAGRGVVRMEDGESGLSARTIARRLSSVSGLFAYLVGAGGHAVRRNPVPRGLAARRPGGRSRRGVPLVRTPRTLPRVLAPAEVDALLGALRTHRDRAMVLAMLLGGLRRCEVLGLRLGDVQAGERRLFIAEGKGGRQRIVPVSPRFFAALGAVPGPGAAGGPETEKVFVVLKGPRRGLPLSAAGLGRDPRRRAGSRRAGAR